MRALFFAFAFFFLTADSMFAQGRLLTRAESSDFKSTSDYKDVISFIAELKKSSKYIRTESIATTTEGRDVPLLVIGNPLPASPASLKNDKRAVVYVQANIHAGEVEGKEAVLMYARDLLNEKNPEVLKNVVILICPFINPDGNEKISRQNRTYQNGPENGVGVRYNGQFLDLNRDAMKAESPEIKGLLKNVFNRWDPQVFMDCHTTDGSYHVEPVTLTWMVNPNGDTSLISYMRRKMIPVISKNLFSKYNVENCLYGEFIDMLKPEKGWILDASEPRYITNYYGVRNRLGILNENYVYADYKSRVLGCNALIHSLMDYVSSNASGIKALIRAADSKTVARGMNPSTADSFAIEYRVRPLPEKTLVKTYEAELVSSEGYPVYRRTDRRKDVTVPYLIDYYPVKSIRLPYAYLLTVSDPAISDLLRTHGIKLEKLASTIKTEVEAFKISGLKGAERLNQGHYTNTITGEFVRTVTEFPAGTVVIRMAQPLANVAAYLLEPLSNDGLVVWNFFDRYLVPQWGGGYNTYPVYRLIEKTELKTVSF